MALTLTFGLVTTACADGKPITLSELPAKAQQTLKAHFKGHKAILVTKDRDGMGHDYEVTFSNGEQIEFNKRGEWKDIECKRSRVPAALVPSFVKAYVRDHAPTTRVVKLSRDRDSYDVELSDRTELEFNKHGQLTDIDR